MLFFFFFNDTATTEFYTFPYTTLFRSNGLIHIGSEQRPSGRAGEPPSRDLAESIKDIGFTWGRLKTGDRKSTRLNSSHSQISYAVFCLKKKMISILSLLIIVFIMILFL